jgi:uncharacterized membrane protein YhhN
MMGYFGNWAGNYGGGMMGWGGGVFSLICGLFVVVWLIVGILLIVWLWRQISKDK